LIICLATLAILGIYCEKGKVHDFKMFKESKVWIHPATTLLADSGYQGIGKIHSNSKIPVKKKKKQPRGPRIKNTTENLPLFDARLSMSTAAVRFFELSRKCIEASISIILKRGI
jgi:hypothetical protein